MTLPKQLRNALYAAFGSLLPLVLWAFSTGPLIRHTGAPGESTCAVCHQTGADVAGGFLRIEAVPYRAGQRQAIRVTVSHPQAQRWGFQLSARLASDETKKAGTFILSPGGPIRIRCAPDGRDATPQLGCGAELEYASHGGNPDSTFGGVNGTKTFEVDWLAPEEVELGDIVFYAAGNAANASGNNAGDRVYSSRLQIEPESTCNFIVQPRVQGLGNSATSLAGVSFNSFLTIYGFDFVPAGATRSVRAGDIRERRFPRELGCVAVEIGGQRVPVIHVQQSQINVQVPTTAQTGPQPVRVIVNPGRPSEVSVNAGTVTLQSYGPALFTYNGSSVAAQHPDFTAAADPSVVPGGRPLRPGDVAILYATGLGDTVPDTWQAGEIVRGVHRLRVPVRVTIGGTTLAEDDILYAGLVPESVSGLYQINVRVPASTPAGSVPVRLSIGGIESPAGTTIPVVRP